MATSLAVARGVKLDPDYVGGGTFALLAKKGAGKTYTGRVLAEEMWAAGIQVIVMDPMGAWWGLRSSADGSEGGIPIAIFGGDHGDAPLERTGGKVMADLAVDEGLSMVLDMSGLGSRAAERQFAFDFLDRLYRRNKTSGRLLHILMDEADLFAPQKPQPGDQPLLGVTENIVRRGRNNGIGITLVSQRSAVLNKDVLSQSDGIMAGRVLSPQDRDAIDAWTKVHADPAQAAEVRASLHELDTGEWWFWIPELDVLTRSRVRAARTYDSSPTRKRGARRAEPKSFADIDMAAIEQKMAGTIERAEAEDPRKLRERIARLESELAKRPRVAEVTIHEVERLPDFVVPRIIDLQGLIRPLVQSAGSVLDAVSELRDDLESLGPTEIELPPAPAHKMLDVVAEAPAPRPGRTASIPVNGSDPAVGALGGQMLEALGQFHETGLTKKQLAALVGKKESGGYFRNNLSALRTAGLAEGNARVSITPEGLSKIGGPPPPLRRGDVLARWKASPKMGALAWEMLGYILDVYPASIEKEALAALVGKERTGGYFRNNLSFLSANGLVEYDGDAVRASESLMMVPA